MRRSNPKKNFPCRFCSVLCSVVLRSQNGGPTREPRSIVPPQEQFYIEFIPFSSPVLVQSIAIFLYCNSSQDVVSHHLYPQNYTQEMVTVFVCLHLYPWLHPPSTKIDTRATVVKASTLTFEEEIR